MREKEGKKNRKDLLHVEIEGVGKIKKGKWTYSRACAFGLVSERKYGNMNEIED